MWEGQLKKCTVFCRRRILGPLGRGSSGEVYLARELDGEQRLVAIKIRRGPGIRAPASDFAIEIGNVKDQPIPERMPAFLGSGVSENGEPWYTMEPADEPREPETREELAAFMDAAAEALELLHGAGYVHGDFKETNLGVLNGKLSLLDFGCSRSLKAQAKRPISCGTTFYKAPEVLRGGPVTPLSDQYSFGVTFNALCRPEDRRYFGPVIDRATMDDAADRFPTMKALRQALAALDASYNAEVAKASRMRKFVTLCLTVIGLFSAYAAVKAGIFIYRYSEAGKERRLESDDGNLIKALRNLQNDGTLRKIEIHFERETDRNGPTVNGRLSEAPGCRPRP